MIETPFLGPPRDVDTWTCGFMVAHGRAVHCDAPADHHGVIFELTGDDLSIKATALCCDQHLAVMRMSTQLDHVLGSACGLPGSKIEWDHGKSWCHMPWGVEQSAAVLADIERLVRT